MPRLLIAALLVLGGCERARPLPASARKADPPASAPEPVPEDLTWIEMGRDPFARDVPLIFVHADTQPAEWAKLPAFWNPTPKGPTSVKVPRGLADPSAYLPPANVPTVGKWDLGRRLFFDETWLTERGGTSCATCHDPRQGFTDGKQQSAWGRNAPTLENVAFARALFWDGRATHLEEVVQRRPEDERDGGPHAWAGAVARLRRNKELRSKFLEVFDVAPNQDTLGQAIATYLRTLLSGDSPFDAGKLDGEAKRGLELFTGAAGCAACHPPGATFSDGRFANIGIDSAGEVLGEPDRLGRFAFAPLGEKGRYAIGAWKTPTLRGLTRTGPYFHNGEARDLTDAVKRHVSGPAGTNYLDPRLANPDGTRRDLKLADADVAALVALLRALDGGPVPAAVLKP